MQTLLSAKRDYIVSQRNKIIDRLRLFRSSIDDFWWLRSRRRYRDGPVHAQTLLPQTTRPWGCSFGIQSDALRRSRPDLFRTIGLAQTRNRRLTQPADSFQTYRSWKSLDRIQFAGKKEIHAASERDASFWRFKSELTKIGDNCWNGNDVWWVRREIVSTSCPLLEYLRYNDCVFRSAICMRHDRSS